MAVTFLPTVGIAQYLPASIQEEVPVLSNKTKDLFQSIQPKLSNDEELKDISSLSSYVGGLKERVEELKEGKERETLHKVLSILSLAALIAAIAGVVLLCVFVAPAAPLVFVLPFFLFIAILGLGAAHSPIEKYRTIEHQSFDHFSKGLMLGTVTLGFSVPIHYIYAAFNRREYVETKLETIADWAKSDNQKMQHYIRANSEMLQTSLKQQLQESERDLAKLEELKSPLPREERERSIKIDDLKHAVSELEALGTFYAQPSPQS